MLHQRLLIIICRMDPGGSIIYNLEYDMIYFPNYNMFYSTEDTMYEMIDDIVDGFVTVEY